ncbi:hypothetical protein HY838_00715 [Candidatus Azambacteria bacterium]|nr:hypothetical protein [Candidatus Azambacteria bacterium]
MTASNPNKNKFFLARSGFLLIVLLPAITNAQFNLGANQLPSLNIKPTLSLNLDPATPLPNSVITVIANLSGPANVENSDYTWFLNGVKQNNASGVNKNIYAFQVGNLGAVYRVNVNVSTPAGDNLSDSTFFTVSDFDITWSASSEAPASYKGKLLPTQNSTIVVSALPFIYRPGSKTLISADDLIFNWTIDDKLSKSKSGLNKSDFILKIDDFAGSEKSLRLEIKTADATVSAIKNITIPVVRPQTLIYFNNLETNSPYGGALKNLITIPAVFNFIAKNYFFNSPDKDLKWQWFVNSNEVPAETDKPWLASLDLSNFSQFFSVQIQTIIKNPANETETAQSTINLQVK